MGFPREMVLQLSKEEKELTRFGWRVLSRVSGMYKGPVVGGNITSTREEDGTAGGVREDGGLDESCGCGGGEK